MSTPRIARILFLVLGPSAGFVHADALVVTRAMQATTILEVSVERDAVRVEIEVGLSDWPAFSGFAEPNDRPPPLRILREDGTPIRFENVTIEQRRRRGRDDVTGERLPEQESDEVGLFVALRGSLDDQPKSLVLEPPMADGRVLAEIGFVLSHEGVNVNDFRYLAQPEVVDLDWDDPWYSRFRNRNLNRKFDAPMSVFLYVEPFEIRKEIVVRPRDLQHWIDLGIDGATIRPEDYERIFDRAASFLGEHCPLFVDGERVEPKLDRVTFVRRTLRRTGVVEPPEPLDLDTATLGVVFVLVTEGLPDEVTMEWDLLSPRMATIPAATSDEAGDFGAIIDQTDPVLRWTNHLVSPTIPAFLELTPPPEVPRLHVPWLACLLFFAGVCLVVWQRRHVALLMAATILFAVAGGLPAFGWTNLASPFHEMPALTSDDAEELTKGLLHNLYTAIDRRDQEVVYDRRLRRPAARGLSAAAADTRSRQSGWGSRAGHRCHPLEL